MSAFPIRVFTPKRQVIFCVAFFILAIHTTRADSNFLGEEEEEDYQEDMSSSIEQRGQQFAMNSGLFAIELYGKLKENQPNENIVFSPFSIQTCVAMARVGAEGKTAEELDRGLHLISSDVPTIAESFNNVLERYVNSSILTIANRIYVMKGYHIRKEFQNIVTNKFHAGAEEINFVENNQAAATINAWVEAKTNNLIKDLIQANALDASTRLVLLNAIHFKGQWKHKFLKENTQNEDFYLNDSDSVKVPMMNLKGRFFYADLPELGATVLDMPYKDTDLSMLIILPNSRTGLMDLEEKLKNVAINDITSKMYSTQVIVKFPKFKASFSVELNGPMKKLGMARMFSGEAELGQMLEETENLSVSKVIHKAFIDVNEEGTEAAAATAMLIRKKRSLMPAPEPKQFIADHPFFYVIHASSTNHTVLGDDSYSQNVILFAGSLSTSFADDENNRSSLKSNEHDEL